MSRKIVVNDVYYWVILHPSRGVLVSDYIYPSEVDFLWWWSATERVRVRIWARDLGQIMKNSESARLTDNECSNAAKQYADFCVFEKEEFEYSEAMKMLDWHRGRSGTEIE